MIASAKIAFSVRSISITVSFCKSSSSNVSQVKSSSTATKDISVPVFSNSSILSLFEKSKIFILRNLMADQNNNTIITNIYNFDSQTLNDLNLNNKPNKINNTKDEDTTINNCKCTTMFHNQNHTKNQNNIEMIKNHICEIFL